MILIYHTHSIFINYTLVNKYLENNGKGNCKWRINNSHDNILILFGTGMYLIYLLIKTLRVYIKRNS